MKLEHVGIAVSDLADAVTTYSHLLGLRPYKVERVESENVETHFLWAKGVKIELLSATSQDSVIHRFIEKRGEGLHHLAFDVDDLEATARRLISAGFRVLGENTDDRIRAGADGKRIFFLHPKDARGVLIECCTQSPSGIQPNETIAMQNGEIKTYGYNGNPSVLLITVGVERSGVLNPSDIVSRLEPTHYIVNAHLIDEDTEVFSLLHNDIFSSSLRRDGRLMTIGISTYGLGDTIAQNEELNVRSWIHIDPHRTRAPAPPPLDLSCLFVTSAVPDHTDLWPVAVLPHSAINPRDPSKDAFIPLLRAFWS